MIRRFGDVMTGRDDDQHDNDRLPIRQFAE
jgi:hypothetical protein